MNGNEVTYCHEHEFFGKAKSKGKVWGLGQFDLDLEENLLKSINYLKMLSITLKKMIIFTADRQNYSYPHFL